MTALAASQYFAYCGVHFTTCPIEVREVFARKFDEDPDGHVLKKIFQKHIGNVEFVPISTCNRFDLCLTGSVTKESLEATLTEFTGVSHSSKYLRVAFDEDAVRMLFRIACSLDSLVLGEPHILGQLKDAFTAALGKELCGAEVTAIFNRCFQVAKRVRSETALGQRGISVGHAAVEVARRVYDDLAHAKILVVGAGEMARIAAQYFLECGAASLTICNRGEERAQKLASALGSVTLLPYAKLGQEIANFDIVVTATSSQTFLVDSSHFKNFAKRRDGNTLAIVDISLPRNVDPKVAELENVFLFDIDDLDKVMSENRQARSAAAAEAERIIEDEILQFSNLRQQRENLFFVGRFHAWSRNTILKELKRTFRDAGIPENNLDVISDAVAKRLISTVAALAKADVRLDNATVGQALEQLFQLSTKALEDDSGKNKK